MILDKEDKEVTPLDCVHYSNVVTVQYADGSKAIVPLSDLISTVSRQDFLTKLRKARSERK